MSALCSAAMVACQRLEHDEEAISLLERALELQPRSRVAADALEQILRRTNQSKALALHLERELGVAESSEREIRLLDGLIAAYQADGDLASAEAFARRLSERRPGDLDARLRLIELGRAAKKYESLVSDLEALEPLVEERLRFELNLERAEIFERKLADMPRAIGAKQALRIRPSSARAREALESLSHRGKDIAGTPQTWDELARALRRAADAQPEGERARASLLKLAQIHERERQSAIDAQAVYREVVDRFPIRGLPWPDSNALSRALGDQAEVSRALEERTYDR